MDRNTRFFWPWPWRISRISVRVSVLAEVGANLRPFKKKAPSPLRFEAAASFKAQLPSRRPVRRAKSPLPVKRRQPFPLPLLLELLLRSMLIIMMMLTIMMM